MRSTDEQLRALAQAGLARSRPPEAVAKAIVRAIERRKLRAIVGLEAYVTDWIKRMLPVRTHHLIARRLRGTGLVPSRPGA